MQRKNDLLIGVGIFLFVYPAFLALWIYLKPYYGTALSQLGAHLAALLSNVSVDSLKHGRETALITFSTPVAIQGSLQDLLIDVRLSASAYSFNVPLTYALALALWPLLQWSRRGLLEITLLVIVVHLLYITSYCTLSIYRQLVLSGVREHSAPLQFLLEFIWAFADNMIIRFEPFLAIVYLWLRAPRRQRSP